MEEYCRQKQLPYMEDKVSSTCKVEAPEAPAYPDLVPRLPSAFSPPPMKSSAPPNIFRPPRLEESEEEGEEQEEQEVPQYPGLCAPFPPTSYPGMLRLLHPHLYRSHLGLYHPYFPHRYYHNK